ncbi:proline iminopeptidase-family hydrolase [Carboxylicivirga marina]|uniref:proline iminopeptidase-family hydrolase n=2 Tax=Carboxylicivirga marina TaxID=2800988 RepID=UPI0025951D9A|nr:proline iminopeptidase-family hydrolase [uncultured Carboxylicivirga sp.]
MKIFWLFYLLFLITQSCSNIQDTNNGKVTESSYFDYSGRDDKLSGGARMIPINTPSGEYKVWTKRVGNNPKIKVLLLHGGPGSTHEFFECFDSYFPRENIEYYYYDQLGSAYSDQPGDSSLWNLERFVDEVEQVRVALELDKSNFYLFGISWGGILGIEYALKYQENLKGLIISNMVSSIPLYNKYASEVLGPQLPREVLKEVKEIEAKGEFDNPKYMELLRKHYYSKHLLRIPEKEWPEPISRTFAKGNHALYLAMQGPSEFGIVGDAKLKNWDRSKDLSKITVPTLTIGAKYDTMDPEHMKWMSTKVKNGKYLYCPNGSHSAMYDDQEAYFRGLISFIKDVDRKR